MKTLQRYIARRIAIIAGSSFLAILGVVWVTQALTRIDFATGSGQSIGAFFMLLVMLTPQLITLVMPFAIVVGTVQVFNTMNSDSELAVISASGLSRSTIAMPVMLIAALGGAWIFTSNNVIEPQSNRAVRDVIVEARTDLLTTLIREGVFTRIERDLTIYVDRRLPGNQLGGIMVSDTRDEKLSLLYYAQTGAVARFGDREVLVMTNGQIHRKNLGDGTLSIIRFNSYAIGLSQFGPSEALGQYYPHERDTRDLIAADPDDKVVKNYPGWLKGEFHRRMSDWMYPFLFAMVGLVVAGQTRSHRQTQFNAYLLGLGGALVYRWGAYAIYGASRTNEDIWPLFYAFPVTCFLANAIMYRRGITIRVPDALNRRIDTIAGAVRRFRVRIARARTT
ncbi:LptF/LptG family permease [Oricola sp.]|uniref:LptF/LptG family permease n=1 Tax=Oricola sp. TaxID=1979950 RepID=UPI003BA94042